MNSDRNESQRRQIELLDETTNPSGKRNDDNPGFSNISLLSSKLTTSSSIFIIPSSVRYPNLVNCVCTRLSTDSSDKPSVSSSQKFLPKIQCYLWLQIEKSRRLVKKSWQKKKVCNRFYISITSSSNCSSVKNNETGYCPLT